MVGDCLPDVWQTAITYFKLVSINDFTQLVGLGEVFVDKCK